MREGISPSAFPRVVILLLACRFRNREALDVGCRTARVQQDVPAPFQRGQHESRPLRVGRGARTTLHDKVRVRGAFFVVASVLGLAEESRPLQLLAEVAERAGLVQRAGSVVWTLQEWRSSRQLCSHPTSVARRAHRSNDVATSSLVC